MLLESTYGCTRPRDVEGFGKDLATVGVQDESLSATAATGQTLASHALIHAVTLRIQDNLNFSLPTFKHTKAGTT